MKPFIIWTGVLSSVSGVALQLPALSAWIVPGDPPHALLHLFGLLAIFLGLMLVLSARDLRHRGVLVLWEGVLRLVGGSIIAGYGFWGDAGLFTGLAGLGDLAIGAIYLVCLPRHLGLATFELLLDRQVASPNLLDCPASQRAGH